MKNMLDQIEIRRATTADAEAVSALIGSLVHHRSLIVDEPVAELFQRRGLGRALWEEAQRLGMVEAGKGPVSVRSSMSAVAVYQRFGFVPTGPMVHEHGVMYVPLELAV